MLNLSDRLPALCEQKLQALGPYFISPDGVGTDCTQSNPCDPATALAESISGDTLYFEQGTYTGTGSSILTINKGLLMYGGWDGTPTGAVVLDPEAYLTTFDGENARRAMSINYNSDEYPILITGFNFINGRIESSSGGAINIVDGNVVIDGNRFSNNYARDYGGAIYIGSSYEVVVRNNFFLNNRVTYGGGAISVINTTPVSIEDNQFYGGSAPYESSSYGTAIHVSNATVLITRNFLSDMMGNSAIRFSTNAVMPSEITNNVIVRSRKALMFSSEATTNHKVWNNTIVDCTVAAIEVSSDAGIEVINNIFSNNGTSIAISGGTISGSHNLFYNNMPPDPNPLTHNKEDTAPCFVDADNDDYHLWEWSDAIDDGTTVALLFDFDGDKRPFGSGYDIGADEFTKTLYLFLPLLLR